MRTKLFRLLTGLGFFVSAVSEWGFDLDLPLTPVLWLTIFLILACSAIIPTAAQAQANSWINTASGTWSWETPGNWSLGASPASSQSVFITNAVSALPTARFRTVNIDSTTSGSFPGTMTISNLTVSAPSLSHNTLFLNNAGLATPLRIINTFTISSGGSVSITNSALLVSGSVSDDGNILLNSGAFVATNATMLLPTLVGNTATGQLTVTAGTLLADDFVVGKLPGSVGTLTIAGGTSTIGGLRVGGNATAMGVAWLLDGQLSVPVTGVDVGSDGPGSLTVSNGTLNSFGLTIGLRHNGTVTVAGGTVSSPNASLTFGLFAGRTGTVWVTGGQFDAPLGGQIGSDGNGRLIISNGIVNAGEIDVAFSSTAQGTLTVAGGTVTIDRLVATNGNANLFFPAGHMTLRGAEIATGHTFQMGGTGQMAILNLLSGTNRVADPVVLGPVGNSTGIVWVTGGQLTTTNNTTYLGDSGTGQITVSNGAWQARDVIVGYSAGSVGALTLAGGTNIFTGQFIIANDIITASAVVWLTGGQLTVTNNTTDVGSAGTGQMTVSNGTWRASDVIVGHFSGSVGALTLAGGTNIFSSGLDIGGQVGATGVVCVTGLSQLILTNSGITIGDAGVGQLTVSNGTLRMGYLTIPDGAGAQGTLTVAGGDMTVGDLSMTGASNATSVVSVRGGRLTVTNAATVGQIAGFAQVTVNSGTFAARVMSLGVGAGERGTLTVAGGTSSVLSNLTLGNFACSGTAIVNVVGGSLFMTNAAHDAVLDVRNGTFTQSGGVLDIDRLVVTNHCGRFVHTGGLLIYGSLVLSTNFFADADGDGMNNKWEQDNGLDPLNPADAALDNDGDGMSNLQEFTMGTNPNDANSAFRVISIAVTNNDVRITWTIARDENFRVYFVQYGTNLLTGVTNNLSPLISVGPGAGSPTTNYLDVGGATNRPPRFYRVRGLFD